MSIWGKLAGAAAGLAIGGPPGALIGLIAGHFAVDRQLGGGSGTERKQIAFTTAVIALGAKMAKADGVVTRDEVDAFREVFKVPESEIKNVARLFDIAKQDTAGFESYAGQIAKLYEEEPEVLKRVLDGLFHIASADGVLHPGEDAYLAAVAELFGFSETEYKYTRARFVDGTETNPYDVLGVTPDISNLEIKKHYRKLIAENHPDRLIAQGVPEEFIALATEKAAAINQAYDEITKERGL